MPSLSAQFAKSVGGSFCGKALLPTRFYPYVPSLHSCSGCTFLPFQSSARTAAFPVFVFPFSSLLGVERGGYLLPW